MATISSLLTFAVLQSEYCQETECGLSSMGLAAICNVLLLASLTLVVWLEPAPQGQPWLQLWNSHNNNNTEEEEEEDQPLVEREDTTDDNGSSNRQAVDAAGAPTASCSGREEDCSTASSGVQQGEPVEDNKDTSNDDYQWTNPGGRFNRLVTQIRMTLRTAAAPQSQEMTDSSRIHTNENGNDDDDDDNDDESDIRSQTSATGSIVGYYKQSSFASSRSSSSESCFSLWILPTSTTSLWSGDAPLSYNRWQQSLTFRVIWLMALLAAWLVSLLGVRNCTFLQWGDVYSHRTMGLGLYTRAYYMNSHPDMVGCIAYPRHRNNHQQTDDLLDPVFQAARVFGAVTALLLSVVLTLCLVQCVSRLACRLELWLFVRFLLPFAAISQALTHVVYRSHLCRPELNSSSSAMLLTSMHQHESSEDQAQEHLDGRCTPGALGYTILLNVLLLVLLSLLSCWLPPPSHPIFVPTSSSSSSQAARRPRRSRSQKRKSTKVIRSIKPPKNSPLGTIVDEREEEDSVYSHDTASQFQDEHDSHLEEEQEVSEQGDDGDNYDDEDEESDMDDQELGRFTNDPENLRYTIPPNQGHEQDDDDNGSLSSQTSTNVLVHDETGADTTSMIHLVN